MEFPLLDLPNELIALVVESIDSAATLGRLACTSHQLQDLTEPVFWRHLLVSDSSKARRILAAMDSRDKRASAVQSLKFPCGEVFGPDMRLVATIMQRARKVKEVMIQSPMCNKEVFEDEEEWAPMMEQLCLPFQRAAGGLAGERPLQMLSKRELPLSDE